MVLVMFWLSLQKNKFKEQSSKEVCNLLIISNLTKSFRIFLISIRILLAKVMRQRHFFTLAWFLFTKSFHPL